jgi:M6 family metalloprotease-like protein
MKYFLFAILVLFELGRLSAQSFVSNLNPYPAAAERTFKPNDTLKILAVMVSFQEDADGTTAGNGKFGTIYTQNYGSEILDPLPHDKKYFEAHLEFVKNYFSKVSKGLLNIEYTVLPDTFSVSQRMRNYSPPPRSTDFTPLADFSVEAWTKADQFYPGFPFSSYDVFLIFHAGVGRDITLPGSIGNERDLPSVYLSDEAFKEIYGQSFEGIPVSGGSFKITNSMIIPETESREVETISGKFLFEITINGLLCASVGSHLGLPDLFNTETGLSAIGRFGLMDGQSIFAYLGVYPPEPSPWEKIKLGWVEPVTMDIQNADVNIVTKLAATLSDTVILKVPLNFSEYFLIENRIRDANKDGSTVTYIQNDVVKTKTFLNDTTGYRSFDVDSLSGVIIDVDEFDWAVPGNGIVIWHIDENVINEKIAENKVNTDKHYRGVDVEEADGVQDIGEIFYTIFGDQVIGEGTEEDFWHKDNPATLYKNRFAKDTRPNTKTNTGANSLITIKDFSEIDNRMSFRVEFGDSVVKPLFNQKLAITGSSNSITSLTTGSSIKFAINTFDSLFITDGNKILYAYKDFSYYKPASVTIDDKNILIGLKNNWNPVNPYSITYWYEDIDSIYYGEILTVIRFSSEPIIREIPGGAYELIAGTYDKKIYIYDLLSILSENPLIKDIIPIDNAGRIHTISTDGINLACVFTDTDRINPRSYFYLNGQQVEIGRPDDANLKSSLDNKGNYISVISTVNGQYRLFNNETMVKNIVINPAFGYSWFSLGDIKNDGNNYITLTNDSELEVYNLNFTFADNFPVSSGDSKNMVGLPLTTDFEGDSKSEIISFSEDGRIFAFDGGSGRLINGFPISIGRRLGTDACLFEFDGKYGLAVLTESGEFYGWQISSVQTSLGWVETFGNRSNSNFLKAASRSNYVNEFFPANRAYNYPNPVYEGTTNIRYYVAEDSKINIKIFDLAGDFVAELNDDAQGGMDNETVWNVGNIQSGVYLARIEANSTSGKTEQAVIKIAIVK